MENKEKNNKKIFLSLFIALSVLISFVAGYFCHIVTQPKEARMASELLNVIKKNSIYYENGSPRVIADVLIDTILAEDKYAEYYSKEDLAIKNQESEGNYQGIGLHLYSNVPIVFKAIGNSPALKKGFKKNDLIVAINVDGIYTDIVSSKQFNDLVNDLDNEKTFSVKINRDGEIKEIEVTKEAYVASYVYYADCDKSLYFESDGGKALEPRVKDFGNKELLKDTAIIGLEQFEGGVAEQLEEALDFMKERNKTRLILDLRDNGGGYMDVLLEVVSYFINNNGAKKNQIVYVKEVDEEYDIATTKNNFRSELHGITVLANHNTASASECLIGAMLHYGDLNFDLDKVVITFNPVRGDYSTYGKGIMQKTIPLFSGGAIKLTAGQLYWPDKRTSIHETGIKQTNIKNCVDDNNAVKRAVEILTSTT